METLCTLAQIAGLYCSTHYMKVKMSERQKVKPNHGYFMHSCEDVNEYIQYLQYMYDFLLSCYNGQLVWNEGQDEKK